MVSEKFNNKYPIETSRRRYWDYSWNAAYFVTICSLQHIPYFGEIVNGKMHLSHIDQIAEKYWQEIPQHFPFVILDEFVIMPDHIHGIIIINKTEDQFGGGKIKNEMQNNIVETQNVASLQKPPHPQKQKIPNKFGPQSQNLASIIRGYKTGVKKYTTLNEMDFAWQPRFYDHIIRNQKSFENIRKYIINNPAKWQNELS